MENANTQILQQFLDFFQTTNKQNFFVRVGSVFVLILQVFLYNQQDVLVSVWRESRLENVLENIHKKRVEEYPATAKEQVQIQYQVIKPDIVLVYEYHPLGKNNFANVVEYEGVLPENTTLEQLKTIPINKQQKEYVEHITGRNYEGDPQDRALLIKNYLNQNVKKIYQCPIYNLDNIYSGQVTYIWYKDSDIQKINSETLEAQCTQSARILGRAK